MQQRSMQTHQCLHNPILVTFDLFNIPLACYFVPSTKDYRYKRTTFRIQYPRSRILALGRGILNPRSRILDPASKIEDPGIQDPGSRNLGPGSWIQHPGSKVLNPQSWIRDSGSMTWHSEPCIQNTESRIWDPGSQMLDPGFRIPATGFRIQDPTIGDPLARHERTISSPSRVEFVPPLVALVDCLLLLHTTTLHADRSMLAL